MFFINGVLLFKYRKDFESFAWTLTRYLLLVLGIGVVWTFEIFSGVFADDETEWQWYATDVLEMLQGVWIFLAFVVCFFFLECLLEKKFQQKHGQLSCLGSMDDSSRVGNITSSSNIKSSNSRDSSRSQTSDVHRGRGRDTGIASSMVSQASISKSGVSETSVSKSGVSKTSISMSGVSQTVSSSVVSVSISLSLGDMDGSSRVGNITSSSSIKSSNSRDSSRSMASDVQRSRGGNVRVSTNMVSQNSVSNTSISQTSVSETSISETGVSQTSISQSVSSSVVSISLSLSLCDMDGASRVGNITSSSSIKSSNSRDSSRSQTSDVHRGRGRDTGIASSMVSQASIS